MIEKTNKQIRRKGILPQGSLPATLNYFCFVFSLHQTHLKYIRCMILRFMLNIISLLRLSSLGRMKNYQTKWHNFNAATFTVIVEFKQLTSHMIVGYRKSTPMNQNQSLHYYYCWYWFNKCPEHMVWLWKHCLCLLYIFKYFIEIIVNQLLEYFITLRFGSTCRTTHGSDNLILKWHSEKSMTFIASETYLQVI